MASIIPFVLSLTFIKQHPFPYCGAVAGTASADVESSNICGFQNISIPQGYSFRTVTFKTIGASDEKVFDLLDVKVLKADGSEWEANPNGCVNNLIVQKIGTDGAYGTKYSYQSTKSGGAVVGWREYLGTAKTIDRNTVTLKKGEGLIILFNKKLGGVAVESCCIQVAGEVELLNTGCLVPQGYSFSGNSTPVPIDLLDVKVLKEDGSDWEANPNGCVNNLIIQKIGTDGAYGTKYSYQSTKSSGAVVGWREYLGTATTILRNTVTFQPGEGFIVLFNKKLAGVAVPFCRLEMPNPIK